VREVEAGRAQDFGEVVHSAGGYFLGMPSSKDGTT
jgi:hypothetical protein